MEKKINVAELLKDCPSGMELDCVSYDNVSFDKVSDDKKAAYPIFCYITDKKGNRSSISFTENGCESKRYGAKCVIFPKGKTTWGDFQIPFKDGDILVSSLGSPFIFKKLNGYNNAVVYCALNPYGDITFDNDNWTTIKGCRLATEGEKEKLFKALDDKGYKWNPEIKVLVGLPKFKVGDRIRHKDNSIYCILEEYSEGISAYRTNIGLSLTYKDLEQWELFPIPNKFDINTLVPFESRVLVRNANGDLWKPAIYGFLHPFLHPKGCYVMGGVYWRQYIPYEGNEHLRGTTDDCEEFYKMW